MSFTASNSGSFSVLEPGEYPARCVSVIALGLQKNGFDETQKPRERIGFEFELIGVSRDDGEPRLMYKEFTLSLHPASSLRPFLECWRGKLFTADEEKAFDVSKCLGVPCLLVTETKIGQKGEVAFIRTIRKPTAKVGEPRSMLLKFDADQPDFPTFDKLPKWVQEKIRAAIPKDPPKKAPAPAREPGFDDDFSHIGAEFEPVDDFETA